MEILSEAAGGCRIWGSIIACWVLNRFFFGGDAKVSYRA